MGDLKFHNMFEQHKMCETNMNKIKQLCGKEQGSALRILLRAKSAKILLRSIPFSGAPAQNWQMGGGAPEVEMA